MVEVKRNPRESWNPSDNSWLVPNESQIEQSKLAELKDHQPVVIDKDLCYDFESKHFKALPNNELLCLMGIVRIVENSKDNAIYIPIEEISEFTGVPYRGVVEATNALHGKEIISKITIKKKCYFTVNFEPREI